MTGVTHISVGAAIGKFIPNPLLAFSVGIISHLIIDKVPHFWPQAKKYQRWMMVGESFLAIILIGSLWVFFPLNKAAVVSGAIGGAAVDFVFVIIPFFVVKSFQNNPIRVWHEERQIHMKNPWWWFMDILMTAIALGVLFS